MRYLIAFICLCAISARAANPAFTDFNANQFSTTGNKVAVKPAALLTNVVLSADVNINDGIGDGIQITNIGPTLGLEINSTANPFTSPIYIGQGGVVSFLFTGNGAGLTNLVGATNFNSSVTYNFNGKTTFNAVSYNTNSWAGPTNPIVLTTNYQFFVASTDCAITGISGQLADQNTWATLTVSNSTASPITVRSTATGFRPQGSSTTTALIIGAGKEGYLSFHSRGVLSTNFVTTTQQ